VHDKQVRRRRAVLGLLVAVSLISLTAYFGESPSSPLHSVQRGIVEVLSPIQSGASRALKPVRDLFGWFDDTLHAKKQRDQLRKEVAQWRAAAIANSYDRRKLAELEKLTGLDSQLSLNRMAPVSARVIGRSPTVWYSQIEIDKGSSDGVRSEQPVITGDGLVGTVEYVTPGSAVVKLITDQASGVSASIDATGVSGIVQPAVGAPNDLRLEFIRHGDQVRVGQSLVTSGTSSSRLPSLFPPGIPIGRVSRVDPQEVDLYQRVHVRPFAQLRRLDYVQVLTRTGRGSTA